MCAQMHKTIKEKSKDHIIHRHPSTPPHPNTPLSWPAVQLAPSNLSKNRGGPLTHVSSPPQIDHSISIPPVISVCTNDRFVRPQEQTVRDID